VLTYNRIRFLLGSIKDKIGQASKTAYLSSTLKMLLLFSGNTCINSVGR